MLTHVKPTFTLLGAPYLEYLPVVDLSSGRLLGMEALVRWQHPERGLISPNHLIPEAEANGDIGPLTRWVLMEACEQARQWSPSVQLGVNCSINQLRPGEVSTAAVSALEQSGFRAGQLTLEVTEDAVVDPSASADLRTLSEMGVQLSVDNVGTNWSSFEPFRHHSISTVKIDGSFIAGLETNQGINRLVVETVIHMAHSLGMSAIAECVETAAQVEIVRGFNADAAQGFFFARPMSRDHAAVFAAGAETPRFSRTHMGTLVQPHDGPVAFAVEAHEVPAPEAGDAPPVGSESAPVDAEVVKGESGPHGEPNTSDHAAAPPIEDAPDDAVTGSELTGEPIGPVEESGPVEAPCDPFGSRLAINPIDQDAL
jgi:EAL domain-containing protein (putative c-di-GMP-specific phosphodiesterase class I)